MGEARAAKRDWIAPAAVIALTAIAFAIRLSNFDQGLFGDELSTAWIVHGRSLGKVISLVYSDAEVTPPLSFVLIWAAHHLGSNWEWLRLPSLIAGTATIPVVYGIGVRTAGRLAGVIAAALCTFSGVMILFSTEARAYSLLMFFVGASTLALLLAIDTEKARWWVLYAASSCLAMYSHYPAAFVLIAQLVWALWAHPEARRPAILANVGAAVGYAPWIPGWIKDTHAVTIPIINAAVPFNFSFVRGTATDWALGYPYTTIHQVPGAAFAVAAGVGVVIALVAVSARLLIAGRAGGRVSALSLDRLRRPILLVLLASATLIGESIYSAFGNHVLDTRTLDPSWPGLAVALGALIAAAGPVGVIAGVLVFSNFAADTVDSLKSKWARPHYPAVAHYISARAAPDDVVVDASNFPVVPLTALDAYLPQTHSEFRIGLPLGPPPYTLFSKVPSGASLVNAAVKTARGRRIFLVQGSVPGHGALTNLLNGLQTTSGASTVLGLLQRAHYSVVQSRTYPGVETLTVLTLVKTD